MSLTLQDLKDHCGVTTDIDDNLHARMLAAALAYTSRQLGFVLPVMNDDEEDVTPKDLEQAVLMLAAHWNENREASIVGVTAMSVPFGYTEIIGEHRNYTFGVTDDVE